MTIIEKILARHSSKPVLRPGDIADIEIDIRVARDFGGANVVKNIRDFGLNVADPQKTLFTFDCNPTGSDQSYAVNQHLCRLFARENGIRVYDIDAGIGTHILIDEGYVFPGATAVSTDSHANILGAIGAFGQGMGDQDIASAWHTGKVWFRVPSSVKITLEGELPAGTGAKDIVLNLLRIFGASSLLGYSVEIYGDALSQLGLDERITIASMATEMGAITILIPPSEEIIEYCRKRSGRDFEPIYADRDAEYHAAHSIDLSAFRQMVSKPGEPHDTADLKQVAGIKIDSAFLGSCTNGRMSDMRKAAGILKGRRVAPGVVLKIVPATNRIWDQCLEEGLIGIFKESGALVSNAGCAGCAAGQVGQNGPGEVTISTGNRNFHGKQGKGSVWLASPEIVAASAVAGYLTSADEIPAEPAIFDTGSRAPEKTGVKLETTVIEPVQDLTAEGRAWVISTDNIDTDMIYHNKHLSVTRIEDMGQHTFGNLRGYEDFARKAGKGDIVIAGKNFGCGSSRQQAVDCFLSLGIQAIIAESFGAIYERNAINAALPILNKVSLDEAGIKDGDIIRIDFATGLVTNLSNGKSGHVTPFNEVQISIYRRGGLLGINRK